MRSERYALTLWIQLSHVAHDGLPAVIYVDVLDVDKLMPATTRASENLNLQRKRLHQTSRSRRKHRNSPLRAEAAVQLSENGHRNRVRACHLNGERAFYFIFRRGGFDHCQSGVHGRFGYYAIRRTSGGLKLEQA